MSLGWRRGAATYLALFFLAVAAAPHHHLNGLEDILLDQPSDSGLIVQSGGPARPDEVSIASLRLIQDVPCLACFTRDFVSSPAAAVGFVAVPAPLLVRSKPLPLPTPELVPAETSSRAPPSTS